MTLKVFILKNLQTEKYVDQVLKETKKELLCFKNELLEHLLAHLAQVGEALALVAYDSRV